MIVVASVVVVALVVAIAAFFVIREANRLAADPPGALFDADDAYEWVVDHLPDPVAATLTPDDVRRILDFQLEFLQPLTPSGNGSGIAVGVAAGEDDPIVVGGGELIEFILERAAATGEAYLPEQVDAVVETQLAYLRHIGAIGPAAREGDT